MICLTEAIFIPNHLTDLLPINLVSREILNHMFFFFVFFTLQRLFQSFIAPVTTFLKGVAGIKFKLSI